MTVKEYYCKFIESTMKMENRTGLRLCDHFGNILCDDYGETIGDKYDNLEVYARRYVQWFGERKIVCVYVR